MDIRYLLKNQRIVFKQVSNSREVRFCCPECADAKFHFYFNIEVNLGMCHRCGFKTNIGKLLLKLGIKNSLRLSLDKIKEEIYGLEKSKKKLKLPAVNLPIEATRIRKGSIAYDYLLKRGVTPSTIKKYGIKYCQWGRYAKRVIIPITVGKDVGFVARDVIGKSDRKYLYPKGCKVSRHLFNIQHIEGRVVIIVEGVFDVLPHPSLPIVAAFGKHVSDSQVRILLKRGIEKVVLMLDPDAIADMEQLAEKLKTHFRVKVIILHRDPSDYVSYELEETILKTPYWGSLDHSLLQLA